MNGTSEFNKSLLDMKKKAESVGRGKLAENLNMLREDNDLRNFWIVCELICKV